MSRSPYRRARHYIKIDPDAIRATQRDAVTEAVTHIADPVDRLHMTAGIIKEAKEIIKGRNLQIRNLALMSLAFYSGMGGLVDVAGITPPTYDVLRRRALGLRPGEPIPIGDAGADAARTAGIVELREETAISLLIQSVTAIVGAQARRKAAVTLRQDATLEVSLLPDWDDKDIADACGISTPRIRADKSTASRRRRLSEH